MERQAHILRVRGGPGCLWQNRVQVFKKPIQYSKNQRNCNIQKTSAIVKMVCHENLPHLIAQFRGSRNEYRPRRARRPNWRVQEIHSTVDDCHFLPIFIGR